MPPQGGGDFTDLEIAAPSSTWPTRSAPSSPSRSLRRARRGHADRARHRHRLGGGTCRRTPTAGGSPQPDANAGRQTTRRPAPSTPGARRAAAARPGPQPGRRGHRRPPRRPPHAAGRRRRSTRRPAAPATPRRRRRAEARRQGGLGAAPGAGHRRPDRQRHQGQGRDAADGRLATPATPTSRPSSPTWSTRQVARAPQRALAQRSRPRCRRSCHRAPRAPSPRPGSAVAEARARPLERHRRGRSGAALDRLRGDVHVQRVHEAEAEVGGEEQAARARRARPTRHAPAARCGWSAATPSPCGLQPPDPRRGLELDVDALRPVLEEPAAGVVVRRSCGR